MSIVADYLKDFSPEKQAAMERIAKIVREEAEVEEGTSYAMPAFFYKGKALVGFLVLKEHLSLFPHSGLVVDQFKDRLEGFSLSSGTIRFTVEHQLPEDIIRDIVRMRMRMIDEKLKK
jgi:uncharacterized protein YdhG (YjbR/CyaY superfamily)